MFRVGIIGCGAIFFKHAYPLHILENTELVAVCDTNPDALKIASTLFDCPGYSDYREILKRNDVDVIHILTPHYLHAPMVIDAANAGKHVLVEKPMAINASEALAEIEAGSKNDVTIGVISQNRYNPASIAVKQAIQNNSLGNILGQSIFLAWYRPENYYINSSWRGKLDKEGGSLLIDQAIHVLDLGRWLIDEEISTIQASISNRYHPGIETEDTAEGLITYRNGIRTVFFATNNYSYNAPVKIEMHCEKGVAQIEFDKAVITYFNGKEITVSNDPTDTINETDFQSFFNQTSTQMAINDLNKWGIVNLPVTWKTPRSYWGVTHFKQIANYYDSLNSGVEPDVSAKEAFKTQEMICAIYDSAKNNKMIKLH